jgi:cephalosporin hydroxylase
MNPVEVDRAEPVRDYWRRRLEQHTSDTYHGRRISKMPEDLRAYQHIIWESQPRTIVEFGSWDGGSALWFADQLDALVGGGLVLTIDMTPIPSWVPDNRIVVVEGDLANPHVMQLIHDQVRNERTMVVDDSAHTYESTTAVLTAYADLVTPPSWLVIEDGVVDEPDLVLDSWTARGVQPAIRDFLASPQGTRFQSENMALYGLTTNIGGWLKAVA